MAVKQKSKPELNLRDIAEKAGTVNSEKPTEHEVKKPILEDEMEENGKPHISGLLNRQVSHEFSNEMLYLNMAMWAENNGYTETAKFFYRHTEEEKRHGTDFVNFMHQKGTKVKPVVIDNFDYYWEDMGGMLKAALKREYETTAFIQEIFVEASKVGHPAVHIAQHYLMEQTEEEQLFLSLVNLFKTANGNRYDFELAVLDLKKKHPKFKFGDLKL